MILPYLPADEVADRADEARQADLDAQAPPCRCLHDEDDHLSFEGCLRRWCPCGWWPQ